MKKSILTTLILACGLIAYAGNKCDGEPKLASKLYIGHTQSADMNIYKSINPYSGKLTNYKGLGYTSGLQLEYRLCDNMSIVTGAKYTKRSFETSVNVAEMETSSGELITNSELIKNDLKILEIPLGVNLRSSKHVRTCEYTGITFTCLMYAGVNTSFNLSSDKTYRYNDGEDLTYSKDNGFSYISIAPEFGWGIEIKLCEKMKVDLLPVFRYDVLKSTKDADTYEIPPMNKFSLEATVSFAL